ncbi:MAG: hypothetical protein P0Y65_18625 [Candidatus Devosia phytovorans]|uniref:Uncharacterized protein n=1 Tax=Candidatus Devosia phytovorans TaxID=3121372 RepID=A0AAJ5VU24_9HYPH|nr:hypothetical protein [Devosia sp.]WEK04171.1 MAG: hypothetical protein P0Y65_18625 [Devosia sp.]
MGEHRLRGIEITSMPLGDAPLKVRQAWIGLILPLDPGHPQDAVATEGYSVLSETRGLQTWLRWLLRRPYPAGTYTGYVVPSAEAIRILAEVSPQSARWWSRNVPSFMHPQATFIFDADCCRLVDLPEDSRETPSQAEG